MPGGSKAVPYWLRDICRGYSGIVNRWRISGDSAECLNRISRPTQLDLPATQSNLHQQIALRTMVMQWCLPFFREIYFWCGDWWRGYGLPAGICDWVGDELACKMGLFLRNCHEVKNCPNLFIIWTFIPLGVFKTQIAEEKFESLEGTN